MKRKPCESCEACAADCGQCQMYYEWLCETWLRYQQYVPRDYWKTEICASGCVAALFEGWTLQTLPL